MTYSVKLPLRDEFSAWRTAARCAVTHAISPDNIDWSGGGDLFATTPLPETVGPNKVQVPAAFLRLANSVIWHKDPKRHNLLYLALWRLVHAQGHPMSQADPLGRQLNLMAKNVGRDIHKMHAFVRFRELPSEGPRRKFAAWFEPEHNITEPGSSFFARRFADMDWLIATPRLTAIFNEGQLDFIETTSRPNIPDDASEELWGTYFANIFNPARVKLNAMRSEMPKKYWKNMPETLLIPDMLADAEKRVQRMQEAGASTPNPTAKAISTRYRASMPKPEELPQDMASARTSAMQCQNCNLCEMATQTVWGEGDIHAKLMIVGEQPGDREDLEGRPFIGPAGQVLREAMQDASINPEQVWLTNAVKHFKFKPTPKLRLHQSPSQQEVLQCRPWLGLELAFVQPEITLALGATAAFALTGSDKPLAGRRGQIETGLHGGPVLISWHPSYVLRLKSLATRRQAMDDLRADLRTALDMSV